MIGKLTYIGKILSTFRHHSLSARAYLSVRLLLLPHGFLRVLANELKSNESILDVGCGYGLVTLFLSYIGHKGKIKWVDIDNTRITDLVSLELPDSISFLERDLIRDGFHDLDGYDTAVMVDILHHLDELTQVKLLSFLWNHCSKIILKDIDTTPRYKYYWNYFHDRYVMGNEILCFLWSDRIRTELEKNGFLVTEKKIWSIFPYPHYMFIATKK